MKRVSQNLLMVLLNIVLIGALGFFAFQGKTGLTGYAVAKNQTSLSAYQVYLNVTDKENGQISNVLFAGKTVYFVNGTIKDYDEKKLIYESTNTIIPKNEICKDSVFLQKQYFYDDNMNKKHDAGEQYIYAVKTDEAGCLVADIPAGFKARLAL